MSEFKRSDDLFDRTSYSGYSGNADELMQWKEIARRGTSGDQVWDILMAWQKDRDALQRKLDDSIVARVADQAEYKSELDALQAKLDEYPDWVKVGQICGAMQMKLDTAVEALEWYVKTYDDWIADAPISADFAEEALKKIKGETK